MVTSIDVKDALAVTRNVATNDAVMALIGEVAATPTANTMLDRLKTLATLLDGTSHIGKVGSTIAAISATFNRPADTTAYASGDLVANSTTAASVTPLTFATAARVAAGSLTIKRVKLKKSNTSITNAQFRIHFYTVSPTGVVNGDNGAWSTNDNTYLGSVDITMDRSMVDSANGIVAADIPIKLPSGQTIYALLEARAAYAPASAETFTLYLDVIQD